jgi:hypothetical protein
MEIDWSGVIEALVSALVLVLLAAIPVLATVAKGLLQKLELEAVNRIGEAKWAAAKDWAATLIKAAAQKAELVTDEQKKDFVMLHLRYFVDTIGLPITDSQLDALIEGTLKELKTFEL